MQLIKFVKSRIRYKFILGSTVISLFVIVVSYIGLNTINQIEKGYVQISRNSVPIIHELNRMNFSCLRLISSATEYAFIRSASKNLPPAMQIDQETNLMQTSCKSCHEAFKEYKNLIGSSFPGEAAHTLEISEAGKVLQVVSNQFIEMSREGVVGKELLEKKEEMEVAEITFLNKVSTAINHITKRLEDEKSLLDSQIESSYTNIIGFSLLTLLFSIMVGIFFSRSITSPLIKLTWQANKFSSGDLDAAIEIKSGDECGILARSFNEMAARIKLLITQLREEIDLTKQAEEKLQVLNQRLEMLMTSSSTMIYSCDAFGDFDAKFVSGNFSSITGYPTEDFYKKRWWAGNIHPDDSELVFENIQRVLDAEKCSFEYRFKFSDGNWHWMHDDLRLVKDGKGDPLEFVGTWQDVTRQKQAEESLKEREHSYRALAENLPAAVYRLFLREKGRMVFFNDIIEQITGYAKEELLQGKVCSIDPFISPEDKESVVETVKKAVKTNSEFEVEYKFIRKDGGISHFYEKGIPLYGDDGKPLYIEGVIFDNTERKIAENKLRESELRFKQISEGTEEWIWEVDSGGVYTYVNPLIKELLGYEPEELIGKMHFYDFFEPDSKEEFKRKAFEAFAGKESIRNFINCCIHKNGTKVYLSTSGFPILDGDNNLVGYRGIDVDITERKKAEDELKQSEMRFRNLVEGTKAILFSTNIKGIFTYLNEAACKKLEVEYDKLIGKFYLKFVYPENRADTHAIFTEQIKKPTPNKNIDVKILTGSGNVGWLSLLLNPIYEDGIITGMSCVALDITARKHAEEALKISEKTYRDFANFLPQPVFEFDINGRFTFVNRATVEISGYSQEELQSGLTFFDLTDPLQHKLLMDVMKRRFEKVPSSGTEITLIRKDGTSFPAIGFTSPIELNGKTGGLRGIIVDITERKKHEAILTQNAARFKMLNDIGSKIASTLELDFVMKTAADMVYKNFNYNHVSLLEYNDREDYVVMKAIAGDYVEMFDMNTKITLDKGIIIWAAKSGNIAIANDVRIDPHYVNLYPDMINTRSELCIPLKIRTKVFGILDIQCSRINAFRDEDINILVTLADQIALAVNNSLLYEEVQVELQRRKTAEKETIQRNEQLVRSNAEKDKFFSIIAHDLRSPFHGLLGLTDMVAADSDDFSRDDFIGYCKSIHDTSFSLFKLIENLLAWSQMQSGSMSFKPADIDLARLVSDSILTLKDRSISKEIEIINRITFPVKIFADENMVKSVMRNLLSNAIKFTNRKGRVIISSKLTGKNMIEVSVNDNGIGLSEKNLKKLFKVEEKVSSKGTEGEPSTGLGLLLCREFIEKNGGEIWVESETGKGSTFSFTLPLAKRNNG